MTFHSQAKTLEVSGITELNASNATAFRDQVRAELRTDHEQIDFEFSKTAFLDSSGLGALIGLYQSIASRGGRIRILNPQPQVRQILELTRMHRRFEIVGLPPA